LTSHARPSPTVAAIILREIEPLHLMFAEEICPPQNVQAMARAVRHSATPIATGERLNASYGFAELIDLGVVDILQPDITHVGGVTGYGRCRRRRRPVSGWRHAGRELRCRTER
jgi:galactonate dehydratase